jgi:acyl-coenzyme A synthetase/AMP-(fatty) acid ligase
VETVLLQHAEVARADVSVIAAFIVARVGTKPDAGAIQRFAAERLAAYKRPREIVFVDTPPRTANGKLMRAALKLP